LINNPQDDEKEMSAASETLLDLFQASDTMETADEDDEIEEEDLVNDPRLMTHIDDLVEEAPLPKPKKRKGSSQTSSTPATQVKKNRTNAVEPSP
jgi:hypothetical protein